MVALFIKIITVKGESVFFMKGLEWKDGRGFCWGNFVHKGECQRLSRCEVRVGIMKPRFSSNRAPFLVLTIGAPANYTKSTRIRKIADRIQQNFGSRIFFISKAFFCETNSGSFFCEIQKEFHYENFLIFNKE